MNSEIKKFCSFLENNAQALKELKSEIAAKIKDENAVYAHIISKAKENGFNFTYDDVKNYEKNLNELSGEQLTEVTGGVSMKKGAVGSLLSLITFLTPPAAFANGENLYEIPGSSYVLPLKMENENQFDLISYLKDAEISKAQNEAFKITNEKSSEVGSNVAFSDEISSDRYYELAKFLGEAIKVGRTEVEKKLDLAVQNGDLPIKEFTLNQINAQRLKLSKSEGKNPLFEIVKGIDALKLSESAEDFSIVQVASQFNALESMSENPTAVKYWIYDKTQGPRASLQAVAAAKHRESADLQNKLPDAIKELLEKCRLKDGRKILLKYPNLYKNGYLQLLKVKSIDDLKILKDFLKSNIGEFKFLSQWVKCERTGRKQLQVFSAAPSFQGYYIDWNKNDEKTNLLKEICDIIVSSEYESIAKAAAIRAHETGKSVSLHLTLVGQGAFNNPPEVIKNSMQKVKKELESTDVKVYLHGYHKNDCQKWKDVI